ncbi:MAG TPA: VOC family protein [Bacteroidia bacterium]|nr:VOC family protein [Bacteroidia bacterium]
MTRLHHVGIVVSDLVRYESNMLFEKKLIEVIDPVQKAKLSLYSNFSDSFVELIQPLEESSFTWNALQKNGNHVHHFCYQEKTYSEVLALAAKHRLIEVLKPVPALLFDNKLVCFYFNRNKQLIEFLINPEL